MFGISLGIWYLKDTTNKRLSKCANSYWKVFYNSEKNIVSCVKATHEEEAYVFHTSKLKKITITEAGMTVETSSGSIYKFVLYGF